MKKPVALILALMMATALVLSAVAEEQKNASVPELKDQKCGMLAMLNMCIRVSVRR